MPRPNSQQDLIEYIARLEQRIALLEQSAVRIDKTAARASASKTAGRIIYDTSTGKLYGADGSAWNALW